MAIARWNDRAASLMCRTAAILSQATGVTGTIDVENTVFLTLSKNKFFLREEQENVHLFSLEEKKLRIKMKGLQFLSVEMCIPNAPLEKNGR
jgi:hypothetical protein